MEKQAVVPSNSKTPANIIETDAAAFKDLVQKLTGARGGSATAPRRSPFKLQQRRKHTLRYLEIIQLGVESSPPENSPGMTRSLPLISPVTGPLTPLGCECERVGTDSPPSEEERAIAEKGFYLHASTGKPEPPVLLTLFPLTSPKKE
ncbi:hypothetical protein ACS0TY_012073 [Phlomoides rotata]